MCVIQIFTTKSFSIWVNFWCSIRVIAMKAPNTYRKYTSTLPLKTVKPHTDKYGGVGGSGCNTIFLPKGVKVLGESGCSTRITEMKTPVTLKKCPQHTASATCQVPHWCQDTQHRAQINTITAATSIASPPVTHSKTVMHKPLMSISPPFISYSGVSFH